MAYEPKPGDMSLFKNDYKTSDSHPLLKGKALLNINELTEHADEDGNVKMQLALWGKSGEKGPFWTGKISVDTYVKGDTSDEMPPEDETVDESTPEYVDSPNPTQKPVTKKAAPVAQIPPDDQEENDLPF